jgi:molybdopterin converting factor subunit 1
MTVRVKLFAVAKDLAGRDEVAIDVPLGANIADVRAAIAAQHPMLQIVLSHALWAVNADYAADNTPINEQSNIALIPPVSGG